MTKTAIGADKGRIGYGSGMKRTRLIVGGISELFARAAGRVLPGAICVLFFMPGDRVAAEQTPLRIMLLGDSITQGDP